MMPDTVIAITIQVNNIAELKDRQASHSNRIKLPHSRINNAIFENANMFQAESTVPYTKLKVTLIQEGIETVANGIGVLTAVNPEFYELVIYAGLVDFFNKIKTLKLNDLDMSAYFHEKGIIEIKDKINATSGFVYPLIDYGVLMEGTRDFVTSDEIDDNFWPGFYLHTLVKEIIEQAGFSFSGDIFTDEFFTSLIVPFTNDVLEVNETFLVNTQSEFNSVGIWYDVLTTALPPSIPYSNQTVNNGVTFNGTTLKFENFPGNVMRFIMTFTVLNTTANDIEFTPMYDAGSGDIEVLPLTLIPANSTLVVNTKFQQVPVTINIKANGSAAGLVITSTTAVIGISVDAVANTFPDMNQSDLIKEFMQFFALVPTRDRYSSTIVFFKFSVLETNKGLHLDWSDKFQKGTDTYLPSWVYAQNNKFKWAEEKDIESVGQGNITSNNLNIPLTKDVVKSGFSPSISAVRLDGLNIAQVIKWNDVPEFTEDVGLRLLASYQADLTVPITLLTAPEPNPRITYFIENGRASLDWADLVTEYYSVLSTILQDTKVLTSKFRLNSNDINDLDFSIPVYVDYFGAFFYINKISNYQPNKLTSVELIRI